MDRENSVFSTTTSVSSAEIQEELVVMKKKKKKSILKKGDGARSHSCSSGDADISTVDNERDLTPGSLEVWVDLPNEIKFDPSLAPFKQLYEQHHGKLESDVDSEGDRSIFTRKTAELEPIGEGDGHSRDRHTHKPSTGDRLNAVPVDDEKVQESLKKKRISRLLRYLKLSSLVGCWMLLTVALLLNPETGDEALQTTVQARLLKEYSLEPSGDHVKVLVKLSGPFQQSGDARRNNSEHGLLRIWLHRTTGDGSRSHGENSAFWDVPLRYDSTIDFSKSVKISKILKLPNEGKLMSTLITDSENQTEQNDTVEDNMVQADTTPEQNSKSAVESGTGDLSDYFQVLTEHVTEKDTLLNDFDNMFTGIQNETSVMEQNNTGTKPEQKKIDGDLDQNAETNTNENTKQFSREGKDVRNRTEKVIDVSGNSGKDEKNTMRTKRDRNFNDKGINLNVVIKDDTNVSDIKNSTASTIGEETLTIRMYTTSNETVPVLISYTINPLEEDGVIYATVLLCFLYVLIIFELVNRTVAALLASSLGIAVLALGGCRPSLPELVSWLDMETLLLLFSMMLLVAILAETGLFDYLAVVAFEVTGGKTWPLINCLCLFTAIFSTFLDNVTTVLLMTPVTIRLCEVMQLNPVPVLMSMVVFSNVGGAATPVGDPPNVIIASHPSVVAEGINFVTFTLHMGLGILVVAVQTYFQLRFMFRDIKKLRHNVPHDIQELRQELAVWRRAAASLSSYSRDEDLVRKALEKKVERLQKMLVRREAGGGSKTDPKFCSTLAQMKQKYRIRDKKLLIKSTICVSFVVIVFFLHCIPELQRLSLGWTALLGALLLLLLADHDDLEPVLARVEWSTLLFFAALFVLMEALSKLGLITWIGNITETVIRMVGEESRLAVALMLVLWVSGIASAFVDNIPLTTMMVRVMAALASPDGLALPLAPLAWALSFGACLGGNGTLIGASANVVCAGVAEQHGYRFSFMQFFKIGFPIMIGHLLVASVYLLICHCAFTWH